MKIEKKLLWEAFIIIILLLLGFFSKSLNLSSLLPLELIGPDPYLAFRYLQELVAYGKIIVPDCLRYYPLCIGIDKKFLVTVYVSYLIYKLTGLSLDFIAKIFSPLMFGISVVIFYFLSKEITKDRNISLLTSLVFSLIPSITTRINAGLFEKEPAALPFILLSFLFYLKAINENNLKKKIIYYILVGLFILILQYAWGGWRFIPMVIGLVTFLYFLIKGYFDKYYILSLVWIFNSLKFGTVEAIALLPVIYGFTLEFVKKYRKYFEFLKVDDRIKPLILFIIPALIFIHPKISYILSNPWTERFASSVAEQQITTFSDWLKLIDPFGLILYALGISFILYSKAEKLYEKILSFILPFAYIYVTIAFSQVLYGWFLLFLVISFYLYLSIKKGGNIYEIFLLILAGLGLSIGDYIIRLTFYTGLSLPLILIPVLRNLEIKFDANIEKAVMIFSLLIASIQLLLVNSSLKLPQFFLLIPLSIPLILFYLNYNKKGFALKYLLIILLVFGFPKVSFSYLTSLIQSKYMRGDIIWLEAGKWIKNNTEPNAVFASWWDYGYYIQTLGNRTTFVDPGNAYPYWNHLVGRYILCGNETTALELLYTHTDNFTRPSYLVIDPTDIGKFYQFSRLGSDSKYDKFSWITPVMLEEISEDTLVYSTGFMLDENILNIPRCVPDWGIVPIVKNNEILNCGVIPRIDLKIRNNTIINGTVYVLYLNYVYKIPLKCVAIVNPETNEVQKIILNKNGFGCLYLIPKCQIKNPIDSISQGYFISNKALNYLWIKLYFFNEGKHFRLVYQINPMCWLNGLYTLKIFKVIYPENFTLDPYKYCLFLARNLKEINECAKKFNKPLFRTFWNV